MKTIRVAMAGQVVHQGHPCEIGDEITVSDPTAERLIATGTAEDVPSSTRFDEPETGEDTPEEDVETVPDDPE